MHDTDILPTLISKVTYTVKEQVSEWKNQPLYALDSIVYLDCIIIKVRQNNRIIKKGDFLALSINTEDQ